jgi:ABC-type antimicrobial peptide transport system, permease component
MAKIQVRESFAQAFDSLLANKMRTFLTLLGIIIGVLTIIAVVSIIQGLNGYVYSKMSFFGANDFAIQKFSMMGMSIKDFKEQMKRKDLTIDEVDLLKRTCKSCDKIGASVSTNGTVKYKSNSIKSVEIRGVTHLDHEIGSVIELEAGRHIQREDENNSRPVCVIGADLTEKLFAGVDPIGKRLKVGGRDFQIIGAAAPKGQDPRLQPG